MIDTKDKRIVAHDYTSVIISILVDTVKNDLPSLKEKFLSLN